MSDKENTNPAPGAEETANQKSAAVENTIPETETSAENTTREEETPAADPARKDAREEDKNVEPPAEDSTDGDARAGKEAGAPDKPGGEVAEPKFEEDRIVPTRCARVFNGLAHIGPLALILAVCLMVWPDFWEAFNGKGYYCPAEIAPISAFMRSADQNIWLTPAALAGSGWIAQWPAYTWLLGLLAMLEAVPGMPGDIIFPLAASLCACVGVLAVWGLAHAARFGSQAAFASGIILLCAPLFAPLPHFVGQSVLSATLMVLSLAFFCRGWIHEKAWLSLPFAFILCGLAGLSGGVFYFALPLVASFIFLIWRGSLRRGQGKDALFGFALLLILLGCWISAVILLGADGNYLSSLFHSGMKFDWPPAPMWWLVFAIAALGSLPWLLAIFGVSWVRVLVRAPSSFSASRHENGSALIWISIVLACLAAPFFTHRAGVAIALVFLAAPLLGKAFMRMPAFGNKFFFLLASILTILVGLHMLLASFPITQGWMMSICPITPPDWIPPLLLSLSALPIIGGIVLLAGIIAICVFPRRDHQGGGLVYSLLVAIILCQPAILMLVPELAAHPQASLSTLADIDAMYKNAIQPPASIAPAPVPTEMQPAPATPDAENGSLPQEQTGPGGPAASPETSAPATPLNIPQNQEAAMPEPQNPADAQMQDANRGSDTSAATPENATAPEGGAQRQPASDQDAGTPPQGQPSQNDPQAQKPEKIIEEIIVEKIQPQTTTENPDASDGTPQQAQ